MLPFQIHKDVQSTSISNPLFCPVRSWRALLLMVASKFFLYRNGDAMQVYAHALPAAALLRRLRAEIKCLLTTIFKSIAIISSGLTEATSDRDRGSRHDAQLPFAKAQCRHSLTP